MSLSGNARATLSRDARSIVLQHGSTALSYGALVATDASGRTLHSWLGLQNGKLSLRVDASGARYPLTIDPLIQKGGKLSGGEAEARFGTSAALSADGSTLLIGAPQAKASQGAVWVFTRSGATWTQQGEALTSPEPVGESTVEECAEEATDEAGECAFGTSVALSADGEHGLDRRSVGRPDARRGLGVHALGRRLDARSGACRRRRSRRRSLRQERRALGRRRHGPRRRSVGGRLAGWRLGVHTLGLDVDPGGGAGGRRGERGSRYFGRSVALSGDGQTALIGAPGVLELSRGRRGRSRARARRGPSGAGSRAAAKASKGTSARAWRCRATAARR